jgi:large subunit ribosomal protein L4
MTAPLKARYFKADGKAGSAKTLPADPFDGVVHEDSLHAAVKAHLANRRQGTASGKTRSEVRGGGRKPWRQKGTGRARAGTIRSPIWRGGGIAFPPIPRSFRQDLPKKVRRLARRSAFNARAAEDRVIVLEDLSMEAPKTRELVKLLEKLGVGDEKVLILTAERRPNVYLSARNLPNVEVQPYGNASAYDVLWADSVVIEESALAAEKVSKATAASEEAGDA